jgi:hypothetical protein
VRVSLNSQVLVFSKLLETFPHFQLAYKIFQEVGLFQLFDIPIDAFIHYFHALESGYRDLPCKSFLFHSVFLATDQMSDKLKNSKTCVNSTYSLLKLAFFL